MLVNFRVLLVPQLAPQRVVALDELRGFKLAVVKRAHDIFDIPKILHYGNTPFVVSFMYWV